MTTVSTTPWARERLTSAEYEALRALPADSVSVWGDAYRHGRQSLYHARVVIRGHAVLGAGLTPMAAVESAMSYAMWRRMDDHEAVHPGPNDPCARCEPGDHAFRGNPSYPCWDCGLEERRHAAEAELREAYGR